MSYLAKLKQIENQNNFKNLSDRVLPKPPKPPFGSFGSKDSGENKKNIVNIAAITPEQIKRVQNWLNHIGEPNEDHYIVLNKCMHDPEALTYYLEQAAQYECEKRRQKVLNILEASPDLRRAYVTDTETYQDNVILTIAIRGDATFEVLVPQAKYDPFLLMDILNKDLLPQ